MVPANHHKNSQKWISTKTTNSCHPRNQSAAKLKPNATWLPAFSYAWGRFHPFQRSVIGSENWCHSLNQSNAELRQVMTWLFTLSARFRQLAISHSVLIGSLGHFPLCEFFVWIALVSCFFFSLLLRRAIENWYSRHHLFGFEFLISNSKTL